MEDGVKASRSKITYTLRKIKARVGYQDDYFLIAC